MLKKSKNQCITCKNSSKIYSHLYEYAKSYMCQHTLHHDPTKCAVCIINEVRHSAGLSAIDKKSLKSKYCVKWLLGECELRECWKAPKLKICDAPECKYEAMTDNHYTTMYDLMDTVKSIKLNVKIPLDIFNIVFNYMFYELCGGGNGLCIKHNEIYGKCYECVFNPVPECEPCAKHFRYYNMKKLKCCGYNINLHHPTLEMCTINSDYSSRNCIVIDGDIQYSDNCCLDLCHQMNTWCNICKKCIGHNQYGYGYKLECNVLKYPHCMICDEHSGLPHCGTCDKHYGCVCKTDLNLEFKQSEQMENIAMNVWCDKCEFHFAYKHCDFEGCNRHSKYPHCDFEGCVEHPKYPHCKKEGCDEHEKYPHCDVEFCNMKHSEFPHCDLCMANDKKYLCHSEYPHCEKKGCNKHSQHPHCSSKDCDEHSEYSHCEMENCGHRHNKFPHCSKEGCREHRKYPHCIIEGCHEHSKYPHCDKDGCSNHLEYPHCMLCDEHH